MSVIALILLVALLIPIMGILLDSPIGRALGRRLEGPPASPAGMGELTRKIEALEAEVEELNRTVQALQEESTFLHRLLAESSSRSHLPPSPSS
jgi:hypothetical protein